MLLGIFAKTFPGAIAAEVLGAARDAGYAAVQYNMACSGLPALPRSVSPAAAVAVGEAAAATGASIAAVSATYNMIHPDPAVREAGLASLAAIAAAAGAMDTRLLTLCTGSRDPDDQWRRHADNDSVAAWRDLLEAMGRAIEIAERYDVYLGIEPELANVISSAARARRLIDELGSERLKIVLDPANLFEVESPDDQRRIVSEAMDLLADRIAMGHAKDRAQDGRFVAAGTGVLDYGHYLGALRAIGFDGPLITHGLAAAEAPAVARFLAGALSASDLS